MRAYILTALLLAGVSASFAGLGTVGDPFPWHSWGQGFNESGVTFDHMQFEWVSGGVFEGLTGLASGWGQYLSPDGKTLLGDGPALNDMTFNMTFAGSSGSPLTFLFQAYNGGIKVDDAVAEWNGGGWNIYAGNYPGSRLDAPAVPAPAAVLLGALGVGLVRWTKRLS